MGDWDDAIRRELGRFQERTGRDEFTVEALFDQAESRLVSQFPTSNTHRQSMRRGLQKLVSTEELERIRDGEYRIAALERGDLSLRSVSEAGVTLLQDWQAVAETHAQGKSFDFVDLYELEALQRHVDEFVSDPDQVAFEKVWNHLNSAVRKGSGSNIYEKWTETNDRTPEALAEVLETIQDADEYDAAWEDRLGAKWTVRELYGQLHIETAPPINSKTLAGLELFGYPTPDSYADACAHFEDFKLDYLELCGHATADTEHAVPLNIEIDQLLRVIAEVDIDEQKAFDGPDDIVQLLESITSQRRMATPAMIGKRPRDLGLAYVLGEIAARYPAQDEIGGDEAERSVSNYPRLQGWLTQEAPAAIEDIVAETSLDYTIRAGMGQGTIAYDPYIAVFDKTHTTSTQRGLYVVFLIDPAAERVFLTLNQGAHEATKASHCGETNATTYEILDRAAETYRAALSTLPSGFTPEAAPLSHDTTKARKYSRGTICYREYGQAQFAQPMDATVADDLRAIIGAYQGLLETLGSTPAMTQPTGDVWRISPGEGGNLWPLWAANDCASVGFGKVSLETVNSASPDVRDEWQNNASEQQLYTFVSEIERGDLIVAGAKKDKLSRVYGIGVVTAEFEETPQDAVPDDETDRQAIPHDRFLSVEWFEIAEPGLPITITFDKEVFNTWTVEGLPPAAYQQIGAATCRKQAIVTPDTTPEAVATALHETLGLSGDSDDATDPSMPAIDDPVTAPYYWVNQSGENGKAPVAGEFLQAPRDDRWSHNLRKLELEDTVFNYHDGALLGYSVVASEAYVTTEDGEDVQRIDVEYTPFDEPIDVTELYPIFTQEQYRLEKYNPMGRTGLNQEYLYCVSKAAGEKLMELGTATQNVDRLESRLSLPPVTPELPDGLYYPGEQAERLRNQLEAALNGGKHVIFTGPPGTGKSKLATAVCDQLTEQGTIDGSVFTTATAEWTAYDTIGGYMPGQGEAAGALEFSPGQFLRCFRTADGAIHTKWLVIDELNRSNIDKAFGQLFSVLAGDSVELPYEREETVTIDWIDTETAQAHRESIAMNPDRYPVTPQWRLLGTMNTADKASLYEMSYAFMRRFAFIHVGIPDLTDAGDVRAWLLNPAAGTDNYATSWLSIAPTTELDIEATVTDDAAGLATTLENIGDRLAVLWANINAEHEIGPALIEDIATYAAAYAGDETAGTALTSAVISLVYPQLEGLRPDEQKTLIRSLNDSSTVQWVHPAHTAATADDGADGEGQADDDREVSPGVDTALLKSTAEDMFAIEFDDKDDT